MALTYSPQAQIGSPLHDFVLPTVNGKTFSTKEVAGPLLVMFICNHCPYVKAIEERLLNLARSYTNKGVQFVAICSNDPTDHPEDLPENLLKRATEKNYPFPYAVDQDQAVAKAFDAVCTPDFFLYDAGKKLFYRGRLDDSWRNPSTVTQQELKEALELALHQKPAPREQIPSMGCSIKWKQNS